MTLLKDKTKIINWLKNHKVTDFELIEDAHCGYVVNVHTSVNLYALIFGNFIQVKFNVINGDFDCSANGLISLQGCPNVVKGNFLCNENYLTSLEGGPKEVGIKFEEFKMIVEKKQLEKLVNVPNYSVGVHKI